MWESRWPSWAVCPNKPSGFRGRKDLLNRASALVTTCPWYVNWHLRTLSINSPSSSESHAQEQSESAREWRISLYKSDQQQHSRVSFWFSEWRCDVLFFCCSRHGRWKFSTARQPVWGCCGERREATEAGVEGWAPGINRGIQLPADRGEGKAQTQEEKEEEGREGKRAWRGMLVYCVQFPWKCHFGLLYKYIFIYITWKLPCLCRQILDVAKLALLKWSSFDISYFSMDKVKDCKSFSVLIHNPWSSVSHYTYDCKCYSSTLSSTLSVSLPTTVHFGQFSSKNSI